MKNLSKKLLAATVSSAVLATPALAETESFVESISDSKTSLSFRFRIEDVSQDTLESATATTLRTRLTHSTGAFKGFSGFVEFDQVSELASVDYGTGPGAGVPGTVSIFDPAGTDLNQGYVQYKSESNVVKYGRQRILLDNQRFVGGVGWRQNEQTYDGLTFTNTSIENVKLFGAYITNVNRIFGSQSVAGKHSGTNYLLNGSVKLADIGTVSGYAYMLDNENAPHFSTNTYGLRLKGSNGGFGYTAEYATQSDAADNTADYSASFSALEGSYKFDPVKVTLGYQVLGADGENGYFITPLATLHAFQGWSDKFLNGGAGNIAGGIQDMYASVGSKLGPVKASIVYHSFSSDEKDAAGLEAGDLGTELGFVLKGKAGPVGLLLKYANYSADEFGDDTTKVWLMASTKF